MCLPGTLPPKWKTLSHDFPVDSTTWAFLEREDLAARPARIAAAICMPLRESLAALRDRSSPERGVPVDERTWRQLRNVAALPFVHRHVVAMPDAHLGATVGSVIPTKGAVVPAAVGVDIGCGMMAVRTALRAGDLPDNLAGVRAAIERCVPHGLIPIPQLNDLRNK